MIITQYKQKPRNKIDGTNFSQTRKCNPINPKKFQIGPVKEEIFFATVLGGNRKKTINFTVSIINPRT